MRQLVVVAGHETMAGVEGRIAALQRKVVGINGAGVKAAVLKARADVDGVTIGVRQQEAQAITEALVQAGLQGVVAGNAASALGAHGSKDVPRSEFRVVRIEHVLQHAIFDAIRIGRALRRASQRNRIALRSHLQVPALRADVSNLRNHGSGELALNVQVVIHRVRRREIRIDDIDAQREKLREIHTAAFLRRREREFVGDALAGADVGERVRKGWAAADFADTGRHQGERYRAQILSGKLAFRTVEVHAKTASDHKLLAGPAAQRAPIRAVCETAARTNVVVVAVITG